MDARDVLLGQLDALRQQLNRCRDAADGKERQDRPDVAAALYQRVAARLDTRVTQLESRHAALAEQVQANAPAETCWQELGRIQSAAAPLYEEVLAFLQGSLARRHTLDEDLCPMADALLEDLAYYSDVSWGRFTLLATSEFYRDTADIIRIAYPDVSLWSLPLAAHEFGHYVGPQLVEPPPGGHRPFEARLQAADQALAATQKVGGRAAAHTERWYHLQEYFADVFATYALGPAYVAAFMLLRTNPLDADTSSDHPPSAARIFGMLWTLETMGTGKDSSERAFGDAVDWLRDVWTHGRQSAGKPAALPDAAASGVIERMKDLLAMLTKVTPERLRFGSQDWLRARALAANFVPDADVAKMARRDILNAAWVARLANGSNETARREIAKTAAALYRRVKAHEAHN